MALFEKLLLVGHLVGLGDGVIRAPGHRVALARGAAKGRRQEVERLGNILGRGAALGEFGAGAGCGGGQLRNLGAGAVAVGHGAAQRRLDHADAGLEFLAALFRGEQLRLHGRDLFERHGKAFLRRCRLFGALVAFARQGIEPGFVAGLLALGLLPRAARADRVHEQDRGGDDGPGQDHRRTRQRNRLGRRLQPDEPRFRIRTQEQSLFRQSALQCRVQTAHKTSWQANPRSVY